MKHNKTLFLKLDDSTCINVSLICDCYYDEESGFYVLSIIQRDKTIEYKLTDDDYIKLIETLKNNKLIGQKQSQFFHYQDDTKEHLINLKYVYNVDFDEERVEILDDTYYDMSADDAEEFDVFIAFLKQHKCLVE